MYNLCIHLPPLCPLTGLEDLFIPVDLVHCHLQEFVSFGNIEILPCTSLLWKILITFFLFSLHVCGHSRAMAHMGPRHQTQVVRLGGRRVCRRQRSSLGVIPQKLST